MGGIRVLHGHPTAEELAAVVVALTPVAMVDVPDTARAASTAVPAWTHAALLEGVGGATIVAPAELTRRPT